MSQSAQVWNFTIDDTSPILTYSPYYDGIGPQNGWSTYIPAIGFNNQTGEGSRDQRSLHVTSLAAASVQLQFYGSAVYLYGSANCSYDISLDRSVQSTHSPSGDLLYSNTNLALGTHFVNVIAQPKSTNEQLAFDYAIVSQPTDQNGNTPTVHTYDNSNSSLVYDSGGGWTVDRDPQIPNSTAPAPFRTTKDSGTVSLTFSSAAAVAVNGVVNYGHSTYQVLVDGSPTKLNSSSFWLIPDTVLYYQANLDPSIEHTINVTNSAGNGEALSINSITVYQYSTYQSPAPPKRSHVGAIVGAAVGAVCLIAAAVLCWFFFRRRRQSQRPFMRRPFRKPTKPAHVSEKVVRPGYLDPPDTDASDSSINLTATPYPPPAPAVIPIYRPPPQAPEYALNPDYYYTSTSNVPSPSPSQTTFNIPRSPHGSVRESDSQAHTTTPTRSEFGHLYAPDPRRLPFGLHSRTPSIDSPSVGGSSQRSRPLPVPPRMASPSNEIDVGRIVDMIGNRPTTSGTDAVHDDYFDEPPEYKSRIDP